MPDLLPQPQGIPDDQSLDPNVAWLRSAMDEALLGIISNTIGENARLAQEEYPGQTDGWLVQAEESAIAEAVGEPSTSVLLLEELPPRETLANAYRAFQDAGAGQTAGWDTAFSAAYSSVRVALAQASEVQEPSLAAQVNALTVDLRRTRQDLDYARREAYEHEQVARHYRKTATEAPAQLSATWHHLAEFVDPVTDGWKRPPDPEEEALRNAFRVHGGDRRMIGR